RVGLTEVGPPAVALAAGPGERRIGPAADPDRRRLLDGLRVDRDRHEPREPAVERRRRVAPERTHHVDALGHSRPALLVGHTAQLELLRILAAHADADN